MKVQLFVFSLISVILFGSCDDDSLNCIRVSGSVVKEIRSVNDFKGIDFNGVGNLHVVQADSTYMRLEGQQIVLDNILSTVSSQTLFITSDECFNGTYQLDIYLTTPDIDEIEFNGVGNLDFENDQPIQELTLGLRGVGNITAQLNVNTITTYLTGSGNIILKGTSVQNNIVSSGIGNFKAFELSSNQCDALLSGIGNIEVSVTDNLKVELTGSGSVFYKGDPVVEKNISGTGVVSKAD